MWYVLTVEYHTMVGLKHRRHTHNCDVTQRSQRSIYIQYQPAVRGSAPRPPLGRVEGRGSEML